MTKRDTWFKCDPTAFLGGLETLTSPAQVSVYVVCVFRIYEAGGRIANNPKVIGALAQVPTNHATRVIGELVSLGKLIERDGYLHNPRADQELAARHQLSETRAVAGSKGGRGRKSDQPPPGPKNGGPAPDQGGTSGLSAADLGFTGERPNAELAENSGSEKAKAFHARARERREEEESPPTPQRSARPGLVLVKPDFDEPLSDEDRGRMAANVANLSQVDIGGRSIDKSKLIARLMKIANMVAPPHDLVLVDSWLALPMDPNEIVKIATRMATTSRGSIRQMRYFDAEIRRVHEATATASDDQLDEFAAIRRRYGD